MERLNAEEFNKLLTPVSQESVSGENCEYDELYLALDELALGTEESEMGDSVIEGKDPDYRTLYKNTLSLWSKTRDLRVASFFTLSSLCMFGLDGLKDGLSLIEYLVKEQFDTFYPQLDPDDDNDPTERINILAMLSPTDGAFSDSYHVLAHIRDLKLVPELDYTLRDYLVLTGYLDSKEDKDLSSLLAQIATVPVSSVTAQLEKVEQILVINQNLCSIFNEKVGDKGYLTMDSMDHELNYLKSLYSSVVKNSNQSLADSTESSDEQGLSDGSNETLVANETNSGNAKAVALKAQDPLLAPQAFNLESYKVKNRNDALLLLKKSAEYFQVAEPTSPVPFLINRALKMANMNFMDLLGEIDQNALDRGREQFGVKPDNGDN